ncbi:hypothetical protein B0T21DRAFT_450362 [Apiosordaria backusii]|uniref:Uncharacterized protein n=1 Tax=Apiosordaria backusii TaxID=314023 RepID=A0AA40EGS8_9PEZI|nr:hypothetical protein B0T21DRAFT_450362 [Apiosordaria backusii]
MLPSKDHVQDLADKDERPPLEFWNAFLHGDITPWRQRDYIRAAYMTLNLPESKDRGLLDIASDFAENMYSFRQRKSQVQHQPESRNFRTKTVFWLYQINLAIETAKKSAAGHSPPPFPLVLSVRPELLDPKLLDQYYSTYLQSLDYSQRYYVLPNLKPLEPLNTTPKSFFGFGSKTAPEPFEHERYLNMAFAIVQRYLREGETRRRSWFIERGFDALRQEFTRMRAPVEVAYKTFTSKPDSGLQPFSETKAYFYVQLVHIALSKFTTGGHHVTIQKMTYRTFKQLFSIEPDVWKKHYSAKLWASPKALGSFQPPDLKPLPDTIVSSFRIENSSLAVSLGVSSSSDSPATNSELLDPTPLNDIFRKMGLEPELPLPEIIAFYRSILLEDAKSIDTTSPVSPSNLPTPAHLFKYIYTSLLTAGSMATLPARSAHLLSTLFHHPPPQIPKPHLVFYLNYTLNFCTPGIELAYPDLFPPYRLRNPDYFDTESDGYHWRDKVHFRPITSTTRVNPQTKKKEVVHTRYHNCPCHNEEPLPYYIGPSACEYPIEFPYEHPPQLFHRCECHRNEKIDQDKLAEIVAGMYAEREDNEKRRRGVVPGGGVGLRGRGVLRGEEGFMDWLGRWVELAFVEFGGGQEERGLLRIWKERREGEGVIQLLREEDGNVPVTGVLVTDEGGEEEDDNDDGKTLAGDPQGENEEEEEDWEVMSQTGTLGERVDTR